jgi:DNA-directed RNA polymerase subunit RPC12/RpoP
MYAVVGCSECSALWVLEGDPETSECPRCGSRRPREKRREFYRSENADDAREARARLLAERQGEAEAFSAVDSFAALEEAVDEAGPDDETYLAESGVDPEAAAAAGERVESSSTSRPQPDVVRAAISEQSAPDAADVRTYCEERGVPGERADAILEKLVSAGEAIERDGSYRLV